MMASTIKIGQYEILEELSHGSITSVYKAYQPSLKRTVLVKRLHQKLVNEADIRDRFFREAQVCAQISHPNIVSVYDFSSSVDGTYLILEFVSGNSLAEVLNGQPFPLEVAIAMIIEMLKGLKFAHDKGVIHRDIKPDNLLLSESGLVKVSDFGLAIFEGATTLTQQGMVVGTPAYMSPEQASGKKLDKTSDIFSLGIVFFEMLTGVNPYKTDSLSGCIKKIISDPSPKLSAYRSDLPIQSEKILNKMMEKNISKRFQDCAEIIDEIKAIDLGIEVASNREIIQEFYHQRDNYITAPVKITSTISQRQTVNRWYRSGLITALLIIVIFVSYKVFDQYFGENEISGDGQTESILDIDNRPEELGAAIENTDSLGNMAGLIMDRDIIPEDPPVRDQVIGDVQTRQEENSIPSPVRYADDSQNESGPIVELPAQIDFEQIEDADEETQIVEPGKLVVNCFPWADVFLDDRALGQPPFAEPFSIEPGYHQLFFIRPDYPIVTKSIEIEPGKKLSVDMKLWEHLGVLRISTLNTWAEIWINGEFKDRTPRAHPLILPLGRHQLELRNPDFDTYVRELVFVEGSVEPLVIAVDLNPKEKNN